MSSVDDSSGLGLDHIGFALPYHTSPIYKNSLLFLGCFRQLNCEYIHSDFPNTCVTQLSSDSDSYVSRGEPDPLPPTVDEFYSPPHPSDHYIDVDHLDHSGDRSSPLRSLPEAQLIFLFRLVKAARNAPTLIDHYLSNAIGSGKTIEALGAIALIRLLFLIRRQIDTRPHSRMNGKDGLKVCPDFGV
ncbi:hypothetical protein ACJZ2D_006312 [Fusarium nematophilum]